MNLDVRRDRPDQPRQAEILHDHRVDPARGNAPDDLLDPLQLSREDQGIERHIASNPAPMEHPDDLGKLVEVEVRRPRPGVVALQSEVDRVCPVLDGGEQAGTVPRRGEQLGTASDVAWPGLGLEIDGGHEETCFAIKRSRVLVDPRSPGRGYHPDHPSPLASRKRIGQDTIDPQVV